MLFRSNAQRHLNNSLDAQNTATERLSSGLRINSAKDDAAGLAIANRMTSQVQGLNQAVRNANDGAALIQTAEGGLEETTNILQRMRELSIQSANGTYDTGNRDTLNAEVKQLKLEIDRISETTSFNGLNVLDGSLGKLDLQVGENANQTIELEVGASNTKSLGAGSSADVKGSSIAGGTTLLAGLSAITALAATDMEINGIGVGDLNTAAPVTLEEAFERINSKVGAVATVGSFIEAEATTSGDGIIGTAAADNIQFTVTNDDDTTVVFQVKGTTSLQNLADEINKVGGGSVQASISDKGNLILGAEDSASIVVAGAGTAAGAALDSILGEEVHTAANLQARLSIEAANGIDGITVEYGAATQATAIGVDARKELGQLNASVAATATADVDAGQIEINGVTLGAYDSAADYDSSGSATATVEDVAAWINTRTSETNVSASIDADGFMQLNSNDGSEISLNYTDSNGVDGTSAQGPLAEALLQLEETNATKGSNGSVASIDISTAAGAQKSIAVLDEAIKEVSAIRGDLGAISNRLDYTTRNLSNISENAASARSQIMDADFAAESANLSRAQVLQQAGNAMLAQANSRPQQVLSLLQ